MEARLISQSKEVLDDGAIIEVIIWELAAALPPCTHRYRYRLFFGKPGEWFVRYDNERGKGDHRHLGPHEYAYSFSTLEALLADFGADIERWNPE